MDTTHFMLSMLFGTIGMGFLMYAKKAGQAIPGIAGMVLMVCPYFLPNVAAMLIVCILLTAAPFVIRGNG